MTAAAAPAARRRLGSDVAAERLLTAVETRQEGFLLRREGGWVNLYRYAEGRSRVPVRHGGRSRVRPPSPTSVNACANGCSSTRSSRCTCAAPRRAMAGRRVLRRSCNSRRPDLTRPGRGQSVQGVAARTENPWWAMTRYRSLRAATVRAGRVGWRMTPGRKTASAARGDAAPVALRCRRGRRHHCRHRLRRARSRRRIGGRRGLRDFGQSRRRLLAGLRSTSRQRYKRSRAVLAEDTTAVIVTSFAVESAKPRRPGCNGCDAYEQESDAGERHCGQREQMLRKRLSA